METDFPHGRPPVLSLVGAGRAGSALALAAHRAGYRIAAVSSRSRRSAATLAIEVGAEAVATPLAAVLAADITLLTVPDGAVTSVAAAVAASGVALRGRGVVHVSARLGPEAITALRLTAAEVGVLHPLQALAGAGSAALLRGAYFRIEAGGVLRPRLERLVAALGGYQITVDPGRRALYHAAAVLVGNAPLALLSRATELMEAAGVDMATAHAALATLLEGAARNARARGPEQALTGPVARGDQAAVAAHLAALEPFPEARDLYVRMAEEMRAMVPGEAVPDQPERRVA